MTEPIRVLQVFAQMNRGGAETMIMNLYRNIDREKIQFDFIVHTNEKCAYDDEIVQLGGKIFRVPVYKGKNHLHYKKSWHMFFKEHPEYKIIHGHVRSTAAIYLKIANKYNRITIAHSHSTSSGSGISAVVKNIMQYPIRNTADYLFACSKSAGEWLYGKKACKKDNFYILNNAIDAKKFTFNQDVSNKVRKEFQLEGKFVVGHVGRFNTPKNHSFLIDIFKVITDKNENSVLMLVGDGDMRKSIEKKVRDLELTDKVIFTGVRSDVPDLLQAINVFMFPSLYEGLGIAVIEAQAAGLPCIVANTVPKEVDITDLVRFLPLSKTSVEWANEILKYKSEIRYNTFNEIRNANFDIEKNAKILLKSYINIQKNIEVNHNY